MEIYFIHGKVDAFPAHVSLDFWMMCTTHLKPSSEAQKNADIWKFWCQILPKKNHSISQRFILVQVYI